jgi:hypothetical protein
MMLGYITSIYTGCIKKTQPRNFLRNHFAILKESSQSLGIEMELLIVILLLLWLNKCINFALCTRVHRIKIFEVSAILLASQWHFLANKHAVLAGCSAFWPVNCIFLHKKTRTRCTAELPFCYRSLFCARVCSNFDSCAILNSQAPKTFVFKTMSISWEIPRLRFFL